MLNTDPNLPNSIVTTKILGIPNDGYRSTMLIANSSSLDLAKNQAVVCPDGIIGRIINIGMTTARVMLITDLNSRIPVRVESTGEQAILSGQNNPRELTVIHLDSSSSPESQLSTKKDPIKIGDRFLTSGYGGIYPPGLPVAVVTNVQNGVITATTISDVTRLEYVTILKNTVPDDVESFIENITNCYPIKTESSLYYFPHSENYITQIFLESLLKKFNPEKDLDGTPLLELPGFKIGKNGIEKTFDSSLRGEPGLKQVEVNATRRVIRTLSTLDSISGNDLKLTLDYPLQKSVYNILQKVESATSVVLDVHTGAVLSLASTPGYNSNLFTGVDAIAAAARSFGLGSLTGIELSGEKEGLIPTKSWKRLVKRQAWSTGETLNIAIGQGYVLATPLQLAKMTAMLVNGLHPVTPHLVKKDEIKETMSLDYSHEHCQLILNGMSDAVNKPWGTVYNSRIQEPNFEMGGKTGSTQNMLYMWDMRQLKNLALQSASWLNTEEAGREPLPL
eukprot:gene13510-13629_t